MRKEPVAFYSEGLRIVGELRLPDAGAARPLPAIVHGPGWLNLAQAGATRPFLDGFAAAGYVVLTIDYRGFGGSDGERGWVIPEQQLQDLMNAVTYVQTRPEVNPRRIGCYGMGGTGGGNAI